MAMSIDRKRLNTIDLTSVKLAILVSNGFEKDEVIGPRCYLERSGATALIVSPEIGKVVAGPSVEGDDTLSIDVSLGIAEEKGFDALILPDGEKSVAALMMQPNTVKFVRSFVTAGSPIAAFSYAVNLLIAANAVSGRRITSNAALREDLERAGAKWVDRPVVVDGDLVTASGREALGAFNAAFATVCSEHKRRTGGSLHTD